MKSSNKTQKHHRGKEADDEPVQEKKHGLKLKRLGIDTHKEHVAYMRADCHVCVSEGFEALSRIRITNTEHSIVANLNTVNSDLLSEGEIALSEMAFLALHAEEGAYVSVSHLGPLHSMSYVRAKIFGKQIPPEGIDEIVSDVVKGNYSNVHLASFITAFAGDHMSAGEVISLTKAMIACGNRITWGKNMIVDKHCIGGLPGNRTTPIVVPIIAAAGLTMPKTSSRAITSPAGTADTMEVMTPVNLGIEKIKEVVEKEGACIAWGGIANLSPADDILIRVERALDLDSEGQMIASVLSKKVAAGSTHVVIDMPVGETAKLRSIESANHLMVMMEEVAHAIGLKIKVVITDGTQPVGRGIGPVQEAIDVLSVLRNEEDAPPDLRQRALLIAGELLELSGKAEQGEGNKMASALLTSGKAYEKFLAICEAQGGFTEPVQAKYTHQVAAEKTGTVVSIDNRRLAQIAKLAGAPDHRAAGIKFLSPAGKKVTKGEALFIIYTEAEGQLEYALQYYESEKNIITIN
ncbi:MAG TPA: thymidine phosphorylase family protein [Bacteroidia bacterium]|nr:thymidine phosphorylase family protein [Bacteroidia bacterium]